MCEKVTLGGQKMAYWKMGYSPFCLLNPSEWNSHIHENIWAVHNVRTSIIYFIQKERIHLVYKLNWGGKQYPKNKLSNITTKFNWKGNDVSNCKSCCCFKQVLDFLCHTLLTDTYTRKSHLFIGLWKDWYHR